MVILAYPLQSTRWYCLNKGKGFTLIEMMIVVVILGVLATLAAPSFREYILAQRIKNAAFDLNATLTYARSEAIMRNTTVTVVPIGASWENGWNVSSGGTTLRTQSPYTGLTFDGEPTSVVYNSVGRASTDSKFTIKVADSTIPVAPRCVQLSLTGLPYNQKGACP